MILHWLIFLSSSIKYLNISIKRIWPYPFNNNHSPTLYNLFSWNGSVKCALIRLVSCLRDVYMRSERERICICFSVLFSHLCNQFPCTGPIPYLRIAIKCVKSWLSICKVRFHAGTYQYCTETWSIFDKNGFCNIRLNMIFMWIILFF